MKYLIAGSSGQLAKAFIDRFEKEGLSFDAPPESTFDITSPDAVESVFKSSKPDVIINCAAYNAVDAAEEDPGPAFRINAEAVGTLATAAATHKVTIVHYGTDYVFDGDSESPYGEADKPAPLNAYGQSKLAGEDAVLAADGESLLLRLSWVYGNGNQNFFHKMLQWSEGRDILKVVWDQISVPTYTEDIVTYTLAALDAQLRGLYHLTNSGYATRYEVARHFFKCIDRDITVIPVGSDAFPSPVSRPFFSAMSNKKLSSTLGMSIPSWEDAVERFAAQLGIDPQHPENR
jgi:dTDP-4-dehydrorhamnose reductase